MSIYGSRNYAVEWEAEGRTLKDTYETTGPPPVPGLVIETKGKRWVVIDDVTNPEDSEGGLLGTIRGHPYRG